MNIKNELDKFIPQNLELTEKEKRTIRNRVRESRGPKTILKPVSLSILCLMIIGVLVLSNLSSLEEDKASNLIKNTHVDNKINPITDEQKRKYYEQYKSIVDKAMEKKTGVVIGVPSIERFEESDWVAPEVYEERVQQMVDDHLETEREKRAEFSSDLETTVNLGGGKVKKYIHLYFSDLKEIEIVADFETQYNEPLGRQLFAEVEDIQTQLANSNAKGEWEHVSSEAKILDGGRTYSVRIEGAYSYLSITYEKVFTIEFHCDEVGKIS